MLRCRTSAASQRLSDLRVKREAVEKAQLDLLSFYVA
jgi:hypothetical protein